MKLRPERTLIRVLTLFLIFGLFNLSAAATPEESDSKEKFGGALVVGITTDVDTFNPLFNEAAISQEITHLMLLGLATLDEKSEFVPELARSWQQSDDYLSLTYTLREDAVWSDGVPVTAEDVKFTYDLLMDDDVASPRQGVTEYIREVVVAGPHTVTFKFEKAYPYQLFDTAGEILPAHILKNVDRKSLSSHAFGRNPVSSGPFVLKKWASQQYIELQPNEKYFGGRPFLDRVIFKIIPDNTSLLLQLQSGEVDMVIGVPKDQVAGVKRQNQNIAIYPVSGRVYYYMGYNLEHPLFERAEVRQALTMAIDRKGIIDALLYGFGRSCRGHIPPMIEWAYNDDIEELPFSPKRARILLADKGWRDSDGDGWLDKEQQPFQFTIKTNSGNQLRSDVAVIIQEQLRQIGIKVEIQTVERSTLIKELRADNFEAYMGGWSTSIYVDPTPIFHSDSEGLFNFVHYSNPGVDRLIELGREEMDREKAAGIWQKVQELIYADQPYTFLFWSDRIIAVQKRFKNVNPIPLSSLYELEKWYISSD